MVRLELLVPADLKSEIKFVSDRLVNGAIAQLSPTAHNLPTGSKDSFMSSMSSPWNIDTLTEAIKQAMENDDLLVAGEFEIEVHSSEIHDSVMALTMLEAGGITVYVSIQDQQILTTAPICPCVAVPDRSAFEAVMLRTHKVGMTLSALAIDRINGEEYYELFGAMSPYSSLHSVITEFRAVANSALEVAETIRDLQLAA
jgi:uncharacterized protein YjfI (DUF2170 family)